MMQLRTTILLLAIIGLIGCSGGSGAVSQYKGTDGLLIEFTDNAPPDEVYEDRPFPVKFQIHNAGAFDVNFSRMRITFSYDPLYIDGEFGIYDPGIHDTGGYDRERTYVGGKSMIYPTGEERTFSIPTSYAFEAKQVYGQRESPETELIASVCYAYTTYVSALVCIDTNIYGENQRAQACSAKDLSFSGGQGAPIAIEKIEVRMLPVINQDRTMESVRPEFHLTVRDVGKGYLVGPDTLPLESACMLKDIPREELNSVLISAYLHNTKLECGVSMTGDASGSIKLIDGMGEISCTVPENELTNPTYAVKQNFETMLVINLTYLYKTSAAKKLTIERTGGTGTELPSGAPGKASGYLYAGERLVTDAAGRPVTLCSYYADDPEAAPPALEGRIDGSFSCSCGNERCLRLSRDGRCIFGDICPANTYCCNDQLSTASTGGYLIEAVVVDPSVKITAVGSNPSKQQINALLDALSRKYGIDPNILKGMAYQESTWECSKSGDGGDAYGLMQINVNYHPLYVIADGKSECSYNAEYGASYLKSLYQQHNDWPTAVRAYNGRAGSSAEGYRDKVLAHAAKKPWLQWL